MVQKGPDVAGKRLDKAAYQLNFADLHPPLTDHEALVESDRCFFCHDAPCQTACPTSIDIPLFIREISTGHPKSAAKTIFDQNILGGISAKALWHGELSFQNLHLSNSTSSIQVLQCAF